MNRIVFIEAFTTDPTFNLAMEEYFFEAMPRDRSYFMTWQNDNAIIIGKHQNTLSEINLPFVQHHDIRVVRRLSGGGAVYHDLGNLNFTFITDAEPMQQVDLRRFCHGGHGVFQLSCTGPFQCEAGLSPDLYIRPDHPLRRSCTHPERLLPQDPSETSAAQV